MHVSGEGGGGAMGLILPQKIGNYDVIFASTATISYTITKYSITIGLAESDCP